MEKNSNTKHPIPLSNAEVQGRSQRILGGSNGSEAEFCSISNAYTPHSAPLPGGVSPAAEPLLQSGGAGSVQRSVSRDEKQEGALDAFLLQGHHGREVSNSTPEKVLPVYEEVVSREVRDVIDQLDDGAGSINEWECWLNSWMTLMCNDRVGSTMIASWVYTLTVQSVCIGWQLHICTNGILSLADDLYGTRWRDANELESSVMMEAVIDNNTPSRVSL